MAHANPYAPPRAAVADVDDGPDGTASPPTWSGRGRMGRLRYLAHLTAAYLVTIAVMFLGGFVLGFAGLPEAAGVVALLLLPVYLWFVIAKTVQRSHDMDWSGWSALLMLIPLVGLIWVFKPGSQGRNRFGPPPPPNTLGVKILGLALPLLVAVGVLAAVALPAYHQYQLRVGAAQQR